MSKKLEKNGLWESSRMMLPQHREALLRRHSDTSSGELNQPKREDIELMRDYVLLSVMCTMVTKKIHEMKGSSETLKSLYTKAAQILANDISTDLSKRRQEMLRKEIRIVDEEKHDSTMILHYAYHGYEDSFHITKEYMKMEISRRLARYTDRLTTKLSNLVEIEPRY
ncbi:hypothetical protein BBG47_01910 [Paenibacillus sp. KS1]|uniref:hypothetical protein n=1 Tax=Paenibacillus sp. KS1 TaxID=1849249 RepID=UPI00080669A9|nr:hypothetical protein [Paenibacillus sp. KS1]OBY81306.1 hypothetical protein BBG47_01910 [Paenibacillus sp. KS1]